MKVCVFMGGGGYASNAREKRCVLSLDLKMPREGASLTADGRLFQSLGPATEKARSPFCLKLATGALRSLWPEDLKVLVLSGGANNSAIYGGARPCSAL